MLTAIRIVTTLGPFRFSAPGIMASADSRSLRFLSHSVSLRFRFVLRLADRASRGKTQFFRRTTSGFTASVLRLPFGLRFVEQPCPPFSLVSGFCSEALRLCDTASSPPGIADSSLRFATLGGNYPWRDFHPLELCHARHTEKGQEFNGSCPC